MRSKGQISLNYHVNSKILYQTLCAFLQIKDRKHIEQNFHSVAGVMPQGWDLGVMGGSKTLAWGFAMAPHRLRILVYIFIYNTFKRDLNKLMTLIRRRVLWRLRCLPTKRTLGLYWLTITETWVKILAGKVFLISFYQLVQ